MTNNIRYNFINFLKGISALAIYTMHYIGIYCEKFDFENKFLSYICNVSYIALPIFFMCTGFLYRNRSVSIKYILKKVFKFYVLTIVVNVLANFSKEFVAHNINVNFMLQCISDSFLLKNLTTHLWFMLPLIIIYLLMPLYNTLDKNILFFITILSFIFTTFKNDLPIINLLNFSLPMPYYLSYFLIGACYKEMENALRLKVLFFFAFCFILYRIKYNSIWLGDFTSIFYNFPVKASSGMANDIFCLANIVFIICYTLNVKLDFFDKMSKVCIYIYLFHPFFVHLLFSMLRIENLYIAIILWAAIYFLMCYLFYYVDIIRCKYINL